MSSCSGTRGAGVDLSPDPGEESESVCARIETGGAGRTREVPQAVATRCDSSIPLPVRVCPATGLG